MRIEDAELKPGDEVFMGGERFEVARDGDGVKLERIPTHQEMVKRLGYDPLRLAAVMRMHWRCE